MYEMGSSKIGDFIILFLVGVFLFINQYGVFWEGYGNMCYSYCKYWLHKERYEIIDAEVISTKEHCIAGLRSSIGSNITYCYVRYRYNRGDLYATLKNHPDVKKSDLIKVAVERNNLLKVERITPYSIKYYHWGVQIILLMAEILYVIYVFYIIDCHKYD